MTYWPALINRGRRLKTGFSASVAELLPVVPKAEVPTYAVYLNTGRTTRSVSMSWNEYGSGQFKGEVWYYASLPLADEAGAEVFIGLLREEVGGPDLFDSHDSYDDLVAARSEFIALLEEK